jgi:gas vesicle protein
MEDDNKIPFFFLGLGLGVAVGLLFAPKSGAETRDLILTKADESKDYLRRRGEQLRDSASDVLEKGKSAVSKQRDQFSSAIEAGKQAYRDAVGQSGGGSAPEGV